METLFEKAHRYISGMCNGTHRFTMSVPVREDEDTDMVLSKALDGERARAIKAEAERDQLRAENERLKEDLSLADKELHELACAVAVKELRAELAAANNRAWEAEEQLAAAINTAGEAIGTDPSLRNSVWVEIRASSYKRRGEERDAALKRVEELEEASRWRKWPEEKPTVISSEIGSGYLCRVAGGHAVLRWNTNSETSWGEVFLVTHWRPITPPTALGGMDEHNRSRNHRPLSTLGGRQVDGSRSGTD